MQKTGISSDPNSFAGLRHRYVKSRETIVNRSLTKNSWPAYDLTSLLLIAQAILSQKFTALFRHEYLRKKRSITLPDDKTLIAKLGQFTGFKFAK